MGNNLRKEGLVVFHGVYQTDGAVTHYDYKFPLERYQALPYMYLVHVAERIGADVRVLGFFFLKTDFLRQHPDFDQSILATMQYISSFNGLQLETTSVWSSKLELSDNVSPPSEVEMLQLAHENFMKIDTRGRA